MASEAPQDVELVHIVRAGVVDCVHRGRVVVVDRDGQPLYAAGDIDAPGFLRSIAKPFQAAAVLELGAERVSAFTTEALALASGSHSGTPRHLAIVREMLASLRLDADALHCGASAPLNREAHDALIASGGQPSALTNNCSGKHAAMLAACLANGWDIRTYTQPDHPLQQAIAAYIAEVCGVTLHALHLAPDGCGVPTFGLPLVNIAHSFARLGLATAAGDGALGRVGRAMQAHPLVYSGEKRIDAALTQLTGGRLIVKDGAEAIVGLALPEQGVGIAVKISDGGQRALLPLLVHLLLRLGYLRMAEAEALEAAFPPYVFTVAGQRAGTIEAVLAIHI